MDSSKIQQNTRKLESEVLDEYAQMAELLNRMSNTAQELSSLPAYLLEGLLPLERKMGLVLTLFKASVWSVLVQKQRDSENLPH
ncbi:hypothetical protein PCANC_03786 [Puccinia coronata f. sp. avenae]|uniref:DASH complex subunit DAD3 n=1 Tax=Puccinia coronata f. sp. avenae TaxID=200324 RepID=A0A2N5VV80_9BASI|nr:hypothetical protein PCANC_03786 [Puccinia coronata f. sp. avenae]